MLFVVFAKTDLSTAGLFGKAPPMINGKPVLNGISNELLQVMKTNLRSIPGVKWQYFGSKEGVMFSYPAKDTCHLPRYDPRLRFIYCSSDNQNSKYAVNPVIYGIGCMK